MVKGHELYLKIWKSLTITDMSYRLMRYVISAECKQGLLLLNVVTGEVILLNDEERTFIENLPACPDGKMRSLVEHRFLVPLEFDEGKSVDQLRNVLRRKSTSKAITGFTILPTSKCNARCFYCYESTSPHYDMSVITAHKVADFINAHCDREKVLLHWFGGEPTMGADVIDLICEELSDTGIQFSSTMISNGYLFSQKLALTAKEKWNLKNVQITLDGTEEVYNKTKRYVNAEGSPYFRVLDNIKYLLEQGIHVTVRMNLGFHNEDNLRLLIDELIARFANWDNFSAYVHELFEEKGFISKKHTVHERLRLEKAKDALNEYIKVKGCNNTQDSKRKMPSLKLFYCMADNPASLLINPLGCLGRCEHDFFDQNIGDLDVGYNDIAPNARKWLSPKYEKGCYNCELFPFCGPLEACEINNKCFSDIIRENKIDLVRNMIKQIVEGGTTL